MTPFLFAYSLIVSPPSPDYTRDTDSVDHIIASLYEVISGEPGPRDWKRFKNLFAEGARLIPTFRSGSRIASVTWSPQDYVDRSGPYLEKEGFFEREAHRKAESYGPIIHVWSSYESRHHKSDKTPFAKGVNSIQLRNDGTRWWIETVMWADEETKKS